MGFILMLLRGVWVGTVIVLAVCHLNHPRLWVQDLLCSASLYWIPFVALDFARNIWRALRRGWLPAWRLALVLAQAYLVVRIIELALPFYVTSPPPTEELGREVRVLFSHVDFQPDGVPLLAKEVAARKPDIIVLTGDQGDLDVAQEALPQMPSVFSSAQSGPRGVRVLSAFTAQPGGETSLGIGVLPSIFVRLRVSNSNTLLLGALDLLPAASQDDFFRSKVTSRRVATLMRYAPEPRMVIGSFEATPFAPLVSMYVRQVHLRSVMFGRGLWRTFDVRDPLIRLTLDHAFVSDNMEVSSLDMIEGISQRRVSFAFAARLPEN
jgi:hypothetical protein